MDPTRGHFPKLLIGTFVVAISAFMIRGFGQLLLGTETARLLAAPLFLLGIVMAILAFVLSVLFSLGVFGEELAT